jgi:hypothetical protein
MEINEVQFRNSYTHPNGGSTFYELCEEPPHYHHKRFVTEAQLSENSTVDNSPLPIHCHEQHSSYSTVKNSQKNEKSLHDSNYCSLNDFNSKSFNKKYQSSNSPVSHILPSECIKQFHPVTTFLSPTCQAFSNQQHRFQRPDSNYFSNSFQTFSYLDNTTSSTKQPRNGSDNVNSTQKPSFYASPNHSPNVSSQQCETNLHREICSLSSNEIHTFKENKLFRPADASAESVIRRKTSHLYNCTKGKIDTNDSSLSTLLSSNKTLFSYSPQPNITQVKDCALEYMPNSNSHLSPFHPAKNSLSLFLDNVTNLRNSQLAVIFEKTKVQIHGSHFNSTLLSRKRQPVVLTPTPMLVQTLPRKMRQSFSASPNQNESMVSVPTLFKHPTSNPSWNPCHNSELPRQYSQQINDLDNSASCDHANDCGNLKFSTLRIAMNNHIVSNTTTPYSHSRNSNLVNDKSVPPPKTLKRISSKLAPSNLPLHSCQNASCYFRNTQRASCYQKTNIDSTAKSSLSCNAHLNQFTERVISFNESPLNGDWLQTKELRKWPVLKDAVISQNSSKRKVHRGLWYSQNHLNTVFPAAVKFVEDGNARDGRSIKREIECYLYMQQRLEKLKESEKKDMSVSWPSAELFGYYLNVENPGQCVIITRKLSGPDLFNVIRQESCRYYQLSQLSPPTATLHAFEYQLHKLHWCFLALKRVQHYAALGIRHNDVKPDNIVLDFFITPQGQQVLDVKIIDLGTASLHFSKEFTGGTSWYESPEQKCLEYFSKNKQDVNATHDISIDLSSDVWASGISITEILLGRRVVDAAQSGGPPPLCYRGSQFGWEIEPSVWVQHVKDSLFNITCALSHVESSWITKTKKDNNMSNHLCQKETQSSPNTSFAYLTAAYFPFCFQAAKEIFDSLVRPIPTDRKSIADAIEIVLRYTKLTSSALQSFLACQPMKNSQSTHQLIALPNFPTSE